MLALFALNAFSKLKLASSKKSCGVSGPPADGTALPNTIELASYQTKSVHVAYKEESGQWLFEQAGHALTVGWQLDMHIL